MPGAFFRKIRNINDKGQVFLGSPEAFFDRIYDVRLQHKVYGISPHTFPYIDVNNGHLGALSGEQVEPVSLEGGRIRITIPRRMRESAGLTKGNRVMLVGRKDDFEIWDMGTFSAAEREYRKRLEEHLSS